MPRNSSNGAVTLSNGSSDGVVKSDEDETMEQARKLKNICDELKAAGCPLFGGRFCDELPEHIRTKADELDTFLNNLIGGSATDPFESGTRDELRILMAQGQTVETFKKKMEEYDFSIKCNAVWSSDAVAYRCNTCAFNPCMFIGMSLCSSCFKHSNHEGHDFNRFFSHSGGACDCGNVDVLNESGFCFRHGPNARRPPVPSSDIVSLGEFIIPKLFVRLFLYFRGWTKEYRVLRSGASKEIFGLQLVSRAHILIEFIQELIDYGGPIRDVLVKNLLDRQLYKDLNKHSNVDHTKNSDRVHDLSLDWRTRHLLLEDIESLKPVTTTESSDNNTCYELECLLDELIFWMVRLIFPQVIVNLCLSLLSDVEYRDIFARRFFSWYLCIAEIIVELSSQEDDHTVYGAGSRIVHISVQILSSEAQCIMLDNEIDLRYKIISSACCVLKTGVQKSTITQAKDYFYECSPPSTDDDRLFKWLVYSVDANQPLRRTSFWTFMSDLQNLLTHGELARRFLFDSRCMRGYVDLIAPMQGMNLNYRIITGDHLEYDNQPYQLAFHFEWEVSSINMFNILSALTTEVDYMIVYLLQWKVALEKWFDAIGLTDHDLSVPPYCVSYHIPLHRHLSAGILRSIELSQFSSCLNHLAKNEEFLRKALLHPLRIQACRAETSAGMWARNGHAARNQSFYYAQTTYNIAFMECDLSLIRFVACFIDTEWLMEAIMKAFYLDNCFAFCGFLSYDHILIPSKERVITRKEWVDFLVDGGLRLLLDIVVVRWNTSGNDTGELKKEIVAALAVSDLTYSKLRSSIPDKGNRPFIDDRTFDVILGKLTTYCEPDQRSQIEQGVYTLTTESWRTMFDPVFCRMRSTSTREYNDALLRYEKIEHNLLKQSPVARSCDRLWLPYRLPAFDDIWAARSARFLITPSFLILVHKIVYIYVDCQELNESIFQATVYLLTLFVKFVTSRQFPNIVMDALTNVPLSIKEMMSKGSTVSDMLASSFTKIVITKERKMSPIIMLLLNYMRQLNDEKAITRESDRLLAEALYKKINMDAQELDSVSGYAIDYIGRLFCLLYHSCDEVRKFLDKFIVDYRMRQSKRDECNKGHDTSPINSARRLAAKRRQEILLAAHQKKNALLMKKMMEIEGMTQTEMDAMETAENSSVRRYGCSICNDTTACTLDHPVGMMCSFLINYVLEHSLSIDCLSLSVLEVDEKDIRLNPLMLKAFNSYRRSLIETLFAKDLDLVEAPAGIEVRTCGHYAHVECYKTYIRTLLEDSSPTSDPLRVQIEISCPVCRATVHTLLPVSLDMGTDRIKSSISNQKKNYAELSEEIIRLINNRPCIQDNESEKFTLYEDLFVAFLTVCDEWTSYREINASTPKNLQMFALELAKNNIERNILLSELDLYDRSNRELLTEHLIHGVRYQGTRRDIDFIAYQWKHITFGFSKNYGNMGVDCSRIQEIWQQSTSQESEISDSSIIEAKIAKMHMENDNKLEDEIPLVVFDLKTTLVRISAYIVTDDSLTSEDRKGLLSFVFQATFYASIVRTAIVAAIHMRKSQLKELKDLSLSNEVFTFAVQNVVNKILSYSCMELEDIFISNATFVDFEKALQFACTDLSRLTAQLWHECGIQKYPKDYSMTNATYMEIYRSLTDCNELSLELLPIDHINRWVGTVFQSMNRLDFLVNLCEEPLSWHRFILLQLPGNYDDLFTRFFGRTCVTCQKVPRMPFICLLCGLLLCLDNCCTLPYNEVVLSNEVERHTYVCCGGVGCFLSLNTTLIAIVSNRKAALWGSVYLDAHGEEDRNLRRGKPLFLSKRRLERLFADWAMQSFDHLIVKFFNFENLMSYLRDGHYALQ